jgi:hypothetical protein
MYQATEFNLYSSGKWRTFSDPSLNLREDINYLSEQLLRMFPDLKCSSRKSQSREDIENYQRYRFVELMDIKKAFLSGNVILMCSFSSFLYPRILPLLPRIFRIYFAPTRNDKGEWLNGRKNRLKAGFRSSQLLLALAFYPWLRFFNRYLGKASLYVDDLVLYSSSGLQLCLFRSLMSCYFRLLGFQFHKCEKYDLACKPFKCGGRLGLHFSFNREGRLETRVRSITLRRYLRRVELYLKRYPREVALYKICRCLYKSEFYPLFGSFDHELWRSQRQRSQFIGRCCFLIQKRFPQYRKYSKKEMANLLWAHRVILRPPHSLLKSGCGDQIGLQQGPPFFRENCRG